MAIDWRALFVPHTSLLELVLRGTAMYLSLFAVLRVLVRRETPLLLIQHGRLLRRNMRRELITPDELKSHLREHGIEEPDEVERAFLEPDGQLSVVRRPSREHSDTEHQPQRRRRAV